MKGISIVKVGDLVKRIDSTGESYDIQQGEVYEVENVSGGYLRVKGSCKYYFVKSFEVLPKEVSVKLSNYRLMNQDTLIKISIDSHEFEVPLGDLIRMQKVCGVSNGRYGISLYDKVKEILDKDKAIVNFDSDFEQYADVEDGLLKQYFKPSKVLKRKAELQEALKELDRHAEEMTKQAMRLYQELKDLS